MRREWKIKRLGDVLELQNGYAFDSKFFNRDEGLPLIRIRSLKLGVETETRFKGNFDKKYVVNAGDLLIGMDGEFGCYEWKGSPALLNQRVCRLKGFSHDLIPRFLFHGVNDYLKQIEDVTGYTTVKHISSKQIAAIEFPVPPIEEQKRIVSILDTALNNVSIAKDNAEKNRENAEALFKSHLYSVFSQGNSVWTTKRLGEVCDFEGGSQPPKSQFSYVPKDGFVRFLQIRDFGSDKYVTYIPESNKNRHCVATDIMIGRYGASVGKILTGRVGAYNVALMKTIPVENLIIRGFLYHYLISDVFQESLKAVAARSAQNGFSKEDIFAFSVPVPSLAEQKEILKRLDALSVETRQLSQFYKGKIDMLDALKKSLLNEAFSGNL